MNLLEISTMARQLKGAPANLLISMLLLGRPTGRNELARLAGCANQTVQHGLEHLAFLGLVEKRTHRNGWVLTPQALQLLRSAGEGGGVHGGLDVQGVQCDAGTVSGREERTECAGDNETGEVQDVDLGATRHECDGAGVGSRDGDRVQPESPDVAGVQNVDPGTAGTVQNSDLAGSSSGLADISPGCSLYAPLPTPGVRDAVGPSVPPASLPATLEPAASPLSFSPAAAAAIRRAVELLTDEGCPVRTGAGKGALDAVEEALTHGWSSGEVLSAVSGWLSYARSPAGHGVKQRGFFVAARIRQCQRPPDPRSTRMSRDDEARAFIEAHEAEILARSRARVAGRIWTDEEGT